MKKVMILGAGHYQLPLIKNAKDLGYFTIVCSIPGEYPGLPIADKWYNVSTLDIEGCLNVAREEKIDGISVCGTDIVLPTIGRIADELGLSGPGYHSSVLSSNKALMKKAFIDNDVRTAKYFQIYSVEECIAKSKVLKFPVVLKIVDSSGSKGIAIVEKIDDLIPAYKNVIQYTKENYIVVEEFIEGIEFGAQAFVHNGEFTFIMPHGDMVFKAETGVPVGHYAPYDLPSEVSDDIRVQLMNAVKALEIDNAAINADFILHNNQVYVLEIGARAGATCLPELVSVYYGLNYYEYILRMAVNDFVEFKYEKLTPCIVELLISEKTGKVNNIKVPQLSSNILDFKLICKVGDNIRAFRTGFDRIGHIVIKGDTLGEIQKELDEFKSNLKIELV